jgi:hypothetical protein
VQSKKFNSTIKSKKMADATTSNAVAVANTAHDGLLPKCVCNWKYCRSYQKYFCDYQHPLFCGVVKLKFSNANPKSVAFKAVVERTLRIPQEKIIDAGVVRYCVARHHFTQALMKQYLADRRAWDWNEPLSLKHAKKYLWSLDRCDIYKDDSSNDVLYMQAPNVPKDQVRDCLRKGKLQFQKEKAIREAKEEKAREDPETPGKQIPAQASLSAHPLQNKSTLSSTSSVTGTLKGFTEFLGHQGESPLADNKKSSDDHSVINQQASELLLLPPPPKEQESLKLRQELHDCQEQLSMLHNMVKQLKDDVDRSKEVVVVAAPAATAGRMLHPKVEVPLDEDKENAKEDDDEEEEEDWVVEVKEEEQKSDEERDEWVVV